ncbi:methionine/alanine import family NSS transporter small subunit [Citricoccus sp. SGAir0253]|nr:methionine/alanine import family NSS transporter small subunit [Citricoccus sp. SGAir0253]QCU77341.1 methionine/alanine import family NSS transporter small subunit [Citricoccus sp. SGAir0253]
MSGIAILFLVIAIVVVWGGMVASLVHLMRNPDHLSGDEGIAPGPTT